MAIVVLCNVFSNIDGPLWVAVCSGVSGGHFREKCRVCVKCIPVFFNLFKDGFWGVGLVNVSVASDQANGGGHRVRCGGGGVIVPCVNGLF